MLLHDSSLLGVQGPGFKKNAFWHVNFSYVVEPTGDAEFVQVVVSKTEAFSQLFCVCHQTLRVPIAQVLFRVDAARQCKHCGLRLLIHVFLESQERLKRPSKSQTDGGVGQVSIAPASRPRWMSHRSGEGFSKTTGES